MRPRRPEPPDECSQCGESIPRGALACPGCGADERTGWDSNPYLPEEDIPDYLIDDYVEGEGPPIFQGQRWTKQRWIIAAGIALLGIIFLALQHSSIWLWKQD